MTSRQREVRFTDTDSVEVTTDAGVLTCYRSNMGPGHGWHAVWLHTDLDVRVRPPEDYVLSDEIVAAIAAAEEKRWRTTA